jgi:hypothetical protein
LFGFFMSSRGIVLKMPLKSIIFAVELTRKDLK